MERPDCLCVGLVVVDHVGSPLPRLPRPGEQLLTERLVLNIGGCAANAAVGLARLGNRTAVVGRVGTDLLGDFALAFLEREGVDVSRVRRCPAVPTAATLVVNVVGEDRRFIHDLGANAELTPADVPHDLLAGCRVLYVGGYLVSAGLDPHDTAELLAAAKRAGVKTVVDIVCGGPENFLDRLRPILPHTDVFLPNRDEGERITGLVDPLAQAERFLDLGAGTVVVTCGGEGCVAASGTRRLKVGSFAVPVLDSSGAGDAFDAGFVTALLAGGDLVECLRWGTALGAGAVRAIGTTAGVLTRAEAAEYLASRPLPVEILAR